MTRRQAPRPAEHRPGGASIILFLKEKYDFQRTIEPDKHFDQKDQPAFSAPAASQLARTPARWAINLLNRDKQSP